MSVPLGGCEKRTPLRSFRLSANQPSTDTPNVKYLRFAFLFFSSLSAHCDKKFSPLLLKFFYHTSHALFVMRKNTLKHQNKNQGIGGTPKTEQNKNLRFSFLRKCVHTFNSRYTTNHSFSMLYSMCPFVNFQKQKNKKRYSATCRVSPSIIAVTCCYSICFQNFFYYFKKLIKIFFYF